MAVLPDKCERVSASAGVLTLIPRRDCATRRVRRRGWPRRGADGEAAVGVEVFGDGGVDRCELLQTSHAPEAEHRAFPSSERQVCILRPVVQPATGFLPVRGTDALSAAP